MTLLQEARRLGPQLEAMVAEGDELRRIPDATWNLMMESGFLRAYQPARFGGGEVTLLDFVESAAEISRWNPSAGWVAGVIGVHPWQLALFPEEAQQELWGNDPTTMHSSSYNPTGKAVKVDGGYSTLRSPRPCSGPRRDLSTPGSRSRATGSWVGQAEASDSPTRHSHNDALPTPCGHSMQPSL